MHLRGLGAASRRLGRQRPPDTGKTGGRAPAVCDPCRRAICSTKALARGVGTSKVAEASPRLSVATSFSRLRMRLMVEGDGRWWKVLDG